MKRAVFAVAATVLAAAAGSAGAGPAPDSNQVRAEGCVQPGVEMQCLVVKDVKSGKLYNVLIKDPRPAIGDGIEFTAVPFEGMTYCMQGTPVLVTSWARKDSLKCTPGEAPRN
ncbi:MAG: hypothetical protein ABSA48_10510 [Terracidiphilus sp.]|jgi:hypothetical protein